MRWIIYDKKYKCLAGLKPAPAIAVVLIHPPLGPQRYSAPSVRGPGKSDYLLTGV